MFFSNEQAHKKCLLIGSTYFEPPWELLMKLFVRPVDLTSVSTIVYHLPDGPSLSLEIDGIEEYVDLDLEMGHFCDTSDIDGTLHFFPKGNA